MRLPPIETKTGKAKISCDGQTVAEESCLQKFRQPTNILSSLHRRKRSSVQLLKYQSTLNKKLPLRTFVAISLNYSIVVLGFGREVLAGSFGLEVASVWIYCIFFRWFLFKTDHP